MFAIFETKCERFTLEIINDIKEIPTDLKYKRINYCEHLDKNYLISTVNKQTPSKNDSKADIEIRGQLGEFFFSPKSKYELKLLKVYSAQLSIFNV